MAGLLRINPEGKDYLVKTGNGGRNSSGPSGRRKMRARNIMAQNLADAAGRYGIVLWSSDQAKNFGTGSRAKFDSNNHGKQVAAWATVKASAIQGMRMEQAR